MQAITFTAPPQWLHVSMSSLNTRFKRCAQVMPACPAAAVLSTSSPVRRPSDIPAQSFQLLPFIGFGRHTGVQLKTARVGQLPFFDIPGPRRDGL